MSSARSNQERTVKTIDTQFQANTQIFERESEAA